MFLELSIKKRFAKLIISGGELTLKKSMIYFFVLYFLILIFWILAWLLKSDLLDKMEFFNSSFGSLLYWTLSKILIWVLPYIIFFPDKYSKAIDSFKTNDQSWLKWGVLIGGIIAITTT